MSQSRTTKNAVGQDAVSRSWHERGFSCGLWIDPPGQVWADYVHDVDELVVVVDGDVEFDIEGKVHRPAPGEELFIPARARHTVRNLGCCESRWLYGYRR
jgi:quercetin dioxygenase-like cupin family protein